MKAKISIDYQFELTDERDIYIGTDSTEVFSGEIDTTEITSTINRVLPCDPLGDKLEFDDGYPVEDWEKERRKGCDDIFAQWNMQLDARHNFLIVARPIE